jgi:uncharacterized protein
MKSQVEIKNKEMIIEILKETEYGTLALCNNNIPYSVPMNFVYDEDTVYFHGSKKGRKMEFMRENSIASLSVVEPFSMIQSYFSTTDNMACPATHFFKSVSCDGNIEIVSDYDEKVKALRLLMEKLQPEGHYIPLDNEVYKKMINATEVFKLVITSMRGKLKLGQHLPKERFNMIIEHLEKRGYDLDMLTIKEMKEHR